MEKPSRTPPWLDPKHDFKPDSKQLGRALKRLQDSISPNELPQISDGSCLSRAGATLAINNLAKAFKAEVIYARTAPLPVDVSKELSDLARKLENLAGDLQAITPRAQWRIASLASPRMWPSSPKIVHIDWENFIGPPTISDELVGWDWPFIEHRAGYLIPAVFGKSSEKSWWDRHLLGLAEILKEASQQSQGPKEKQNERNRNSQQEIENGINTFNDSIGYAGYFFVQECDAILCAAENVEIEKGPLLVESNVKGHQYHKGLKEFSKAVFSYATGIEARSQLDRYLKEYASYCYPISEKTWIWRTFRIISLRLQDLNFNKKSYISSDLLANLEDLHTRYKSLVCLKESDYKQDLENANQVLKEFERQLAELSDEPVSSTKFLNLSEEARDNAKRDIEESIEYCKKRRDGLAVLAGVRSLVPGQEQNVAGSRRPGFQTLPRGVTYLSGLVE